MTAPNNFTPYSMIQDAMFEAGLLQEGQVPTGEPLARNLRRLNHMVNQWITRGIKLWLDFPVSITLVSGTQTYTLAPLDQHGVATRPYNVIEAYYIDVNLIRRPLNVLAWKDWELLSNRSQTGALNSYFVNKQQLSTTISFYLTPDTTAATGTAEALVRQQATNAISLTEVMNFPIEWGMALIWGLANQICGGQPQSTLDRCEKFATKYQMELEDWDVEDAPTQYVPDPQQTRPSNFR